MPTQLPVSRPKRGRRKKRPDLTDTQRKALRALQNRQATRRSRERTRARAEQLKSQLSQSLRENSLLQAERDRLLAHVEAGKSGGDARGRSEPLLRAHSHETCVRTLSQRKYPWRRSDRPVNPMSLEVILNHDMPVPVESNREAKGLQALETDDALREKVLTPPAKRFSAEWNDCDISPVSITSPSTTRTGFSRRGSASS